MKRWGPLVCALLVVCRVSPSQPAGGSAPPMLLFNAHAHNDYVHEHPLFDALNNGFQSVEADIWLVDGKLLVAHDLPQVTPEKTLQAQYLDPLRALARKNHGRIYRHGPTFTLLIELKSAGEPTYSVLREQLKPYRDLLSVTHNGHADHKAIDVIITGHIPRSMIAADDPRYAACDGGLGDLDSDVPADLVPWISTDWMSHFHWLGSGTMTDADKTRLQQILEKAHRHGRRVRFWGSPDYARFWTGLLDMGVDIMNVDHLPEYQKFMQARASAAGQKTQPATY